ncbi:GNAT family N-acetyltransferase [Deinococcus maricopensis]|uniref:GCN5-related N-acetyltransferase n=1 Tax=Deinococcus maricopensis (strain DSM 21211 / LMG 22137 / NRRL B-23946 / LB-34) TaxID=709986 RepID=E8U6B3_DEIML|nr:GNAT family N-acetyltransferase [Deinococcus maricopensis]ADV66602.1 GCN5-related N-acetyltransferase [Deinococcus maricopensis DSM 21211]
MTLTATPTETEVKLSAATPADHDTIRALLNTCGLTTQSLNFDAPGTFWVARQDGRPVGCIGLEHGQGASLLRSTCVLPEARGLGVGRALVRSALTLATLRGDHGVYLFSNDAPDYWTRLGFSEVPSATLADVLPDAPQVLSGVTRGWIHEERAWHLELAPRPEQPEHLEEHEPQ